MEPMAIGPWVFGETEQNGESITDEMQICQVTSPMVPKSPDCSTDEYALFSVCIIREPTGTVNNDSVWCQHLNTVVKMDAELQMNEDLDLVQTPAPANKFKLQRPVVWNESYQPEKPKEWVRLDIPHMKESTPAPVRQLDWSTFEEDDSYLGKIPQEWTQPIAPQPQVDSSSMMGEPQVVPSKKRKGCTIEDGRAIKAYENDLPFILPHGSGDNNPMTIIQEQ
ncbi:hypothetical protein F5J12DRAFT_785114 [Pisolithus orientalis]|uniref:uncharacterized protein n=1 Tax=Pisolithus orientalis TaxID=936130 RepID=UPI0022257DE1|nr:uncharacterized protein F5J12DRAFT_785114 [Pisolithus orientalis]KAI5997652.1 hypothetical protein F5J12DRAFT_785114 [Pisolithus orientalis]